MTVLDARSRAIEFAVLWTAGVLSAVAVLPYAITLQQSVLERVPLPLATIVALSIVQSAILLAIATGLGLFLAHRLGLGAPLLEAWLAGRPQVPGMARGLALAAAAGAGVGAALLAFEVAVFLPRLPDALRSPATPPGPGQGALAALYGGIGEELLTRLFLLTLFAWLLSRLARGHARGRPSDAVLWTATVAAALLFGALHLPATAALTSITPLVATRALLLNGIAGLAFGWLYWSRGLESAMIAHFTADIVIHVIAPAALAT